MKKLNLLLSILTVAILFASCSHEKHTYQYKFSIQHGVASVHDVLVAGDVSKLQLETVNFTINEEGTTKPVLTLKVDKGNQSLYCDYTVVSDHVLSYTVLSENRVN